MEITIKKIKIPKKLEDELKYFFIGGMTYNKEFKFHKSKNHYPFTTYYINKIQDVEENNIIYRSLIYCKLPIICLQFENYCECIEFKLPAECQGAEIIPFVGLNETESYYEIIFKHFPEITVKEKEHAWLGIGKNKKERMVYGQVKFNIKQYKTKSWEEAVKKFFEKQKIKPKNIAKEINIKKMMKNARNALFRSYDNENGTFLQLPWKNTTGFAFGMYSYSLLSFEAKRLNYFNELYKKTKDGQYKEWINKLENLFTNPNLYEKTEKGLFWYNMTHFNGKGLEGYSYLDVGYAGYPGGQGTISYCIGRYLQNNKDKQLKKLLKSNLDYIVNTQNRDGSWNSAINYSKIKSRKWNKCEGATAENVRALMMGYKLFKKEKYKKSAKKGLAFLEDDNIICKNVLRDIGIDEPEGFSAILTVNAFLDAYNFLKNKKYLKYAKLYAHHLLSYHYWHSWRDDLEGHFHPITESITPRISPYESLLTVKTYHRLYKKTRKKFWKNISDFLFSRVIKFVDNNGGLSEGVFPKYPKGLYYLPMEQTFATSELLHTCLIYDFYKSKKETKKENKMKLNIENKNNCFIIEDSVKVNKNKFLIIKDGNKLEIYMSHPYTKKSIIKTKILNIMRKLGKLNTLLDMKYIFKGVKPKEKGKNMQLVNNYVESYKVIQNKNTLNVYAKLPFHFIKITFYKTRTGLKMNIQIEIKGHNLQCNKVIILFGKKYNETLKTNWTHGGIYKNVFAL